MIHILGVLRGFEVIGRSPFRGEMEVYASYWSQVDYDAELTLVVAIVLGARRTLVERLLRFSKSIHV